MRTCTQKPKPPSHSAAKGEQLKVRTPSIIRRIPKNIFKKVPILDWSVKDVNNHYFKFGVSVHELGLPLFIIAVFIAIGSPLYL